MYYGTKEHVILKKTKHDEYYLIKLNVKSTVDTMYVFSFLVYFTKACDIVIALIDNKMIKW